MKKVTHLFITPRAVLDCIIERIDDYEQIYIVAITKDKDAEVSVAGDLKGLAFGIQVLSEHWRSHFGGGE